MRLERRLFDSKVALRVFLSFVLVGLVPVLVLAYLSSSRVSESLEEQAYEQLDMVGRMIGQQLLDRLLIARDALSLVGDESQVDRPTGIDAVRIVTAANESRPLGPEFEWARRFDPSAGKPMLTVRTGSAGQGIYIATSTPTGFAVGRVDPGRLWSVAGLLPFGLELCVVETHSHRVLYCSRELPAEGRQVVASEIATNTAGQFVLRDGDDEWLAAHWQLFLPSRFEAEPWSVIISRPASLALAPLNAFNQAFVYAILASLVVTALLSAAQIRRTLRPLHRLVAGTKQIAQRRFDTRMTIESRDEFGELGDAMNSMTERLGRQFGAMEAFANIDRLILSSVSIEQVLEQVLDRAKAVVPDCRLSVLLVDPDQSSRGMIYAQARPGSVEAGLARTEVKPELYEWLLETREGSVNETGTVRRLNDDLLVAEDCDGVALEPMFVGGEVRGVLIAQFERSVLDENAFELIRELARRLAVAISAADREQALFDRAHFDSLTGLPNRQLCRDRLRQAVAQARREGHQLAVLFIDLDRFKNVNDSLGHTLGDELLKEAALRLSGCVRESDTAARLGGDEYVVILPHIYGPLEVDAICSKLITQLSRPYVIEGHEAFISASVGASIFPDDGQTSEELLRCADTAMYSAKDSGRGRWAFFTQELDHRVRERLSLLSDLHGALERDEFRLVYQPQIDLHSGRVVCAEALLRWEHPARGIVRPGVFVPVLEDIELIETIGRWIIERALSDFRTWRERGIRLPRVSVNLAGRQLFDRGLSDFVQSQLKRKNLEGSHLEFELTEHNLVTDFVQANRMFREMRGIGVRVGIDDFGTGYSSLGYLQELHFDCLKVDRAFINGLPGSRSQAIVEAVLTVSHALGKEVVAEGIETEEQHARLVEMGCDLGQGYWFSRPLSADECFDWLLRHEESTREVQYLGAL